MAESAVEFLLTELSRVLKEEVNLQRGVKQDIESVKEELETMKAFLRFADAREEDDPRLQSWVKQVRDAALDIEVVLDEFLLQIADGNDEDRQRHNTCLHRICPSIRKWKAKHQIGSKLRTIKAKVNDIAERQKKYGYSPPPNLYEQGSSSVTSSTNEIDQFRMNALLVDESQLVGIDATKRELINWLLHADPDLKVLAIVGMGGLGKTTLAKQIYRDDLVKHQFTKRAFVTVSQSLKEDELLKDIIQQLFPGETEMQQLPMIRLKESMKERLQNERYLIILDDMWRTEHWDQLKLALPRNNCASRVIITSRITEVATYSSYEFKGMVHNLLHLSESDSWTLFCKKTFPTQGCPSNLETICQQILEKCGGVPLAILAIGGLLATKDVHKVEAWEMVQRSLNVELEENPRLKMMNKILSLSFHDLPYHLKPCYMFLGIFPEDHNINSMRLIRLWISEGFVDEKDGRTLEEVANSYLYELLNRSLIQISTKRDGRVKNCRIHDFLREMVLSKSREQRFFEVISTEYTKRQPEKVRRLSIHHHEGQMYQMKSSLLSRLRSLFLFEADDTSSSSSQMTKLPGDGFKLLSVLDLTGAPLNMFPEEISTLILLRYLSLRHTKISELPKSIRNLRRLETLDLKQTFVTELPSEISMLQKLRHLLICRYERSSYRLGLGDMLAKLNSEPGATVSMFRVFGFKVTPEIGGLLSLQKLSFLEAPEDSDSIKVLGRLIQLRQICLVNLREEHWCDLCSSISKMRNLRSLTLHTTGTFDLKYISSPPPLLQRLHLTGHLDELPSWVFSLQNLQVLHLIFTGLKERPTASLSELPNMEYVVLCEPSHSSVNFWMERLDNYAVMLSGDVEKEEFRFLEGPLISFEGEVLRNVRELRDRLRQRQL